MDLKKRYIVDLSQAQNPADIVFELSNIIEKPEAANQKIWLKLGDINLNQSQILSIQSLISSINSTLSLIESQSQQTELAAATLGICTKDVEEEIEKELEENTPEAPLNTENDTPVQQYIPMTDHIDTEETKEDKEEISEENKVEIKEQEELNTESAKQESVNAEESNPSSSSDLQEKEIITQPEDESESNQDNLFGKIDSLIENASYSSIAKAENIQEETQQQENSETETETENITENSNQINEEEIQEQLDSIFDSEKKLENILSDDKDINEMKNWPLTKEAQEFEIPDEEMTDEDYEILQMNTQYHKQTVRSGQVIKSNGNVVIIGDCHPGCEIHAAGDITVWGVLGGIAHAGCKGNTKARIRALNLNAIQLRIAESYARRPDHIKNMFSEKTNVFTPEEARNINGSIVILKIND